MHSACVCVCFEEEKKISVDSCVSAKEADIKMCAAVADLQREA